MSRLPPPPPPPPPPRRATAATTSTTASTYLPAQPGAPRFWFWILAGAAAVLLVLLLALAWWWSRSTAVAAASGPQQAQQTQQDRQAQNSQQAPLPVWDFSQWLAGRSADWRVGRLKEEPAVVVIEFPNLAEQGAAMNRLAALLEKTDAPRDRLLGNAELASLIAQGGDSPQTFYQGHDYGGAGLARFFSMAQAQQLALDTAERRLLQILTDAGVLAPARDGAQGYVQIGLQALISFSATQVDDPSTPASETIDEVQRESILRHEASHGRFYTRTGYQAHSRRFWQTELSEPQRERIRVYLASAGYNRQDEELMLNEAQAFMMHTPDRRAFMAQDIGMTPAQLDALRERFWRTLPAE